MKCKILNCLSMALLAAHLAAPASADDYLHNQCNMMLGQTADNSLTMTLVGEIGDFYVPRDAPLGTPINAPFATLVGVVNSQGLTVVCNRSGQDPQPVFTSDVVAVSTLYGGTLPNIGGRELAGKVFTTSIPGVGLAIEFESPYYSNASNQFQPTTPTRLPPFLAENRSTSGGQMIMQGVLFRPLLVKIGNIAPGVHTIAPNVLVKAGFTGTPNAYTLAVTGTVRTAQCSLALTDPVSEVPVPLGTWSSNDFSGPGSSTTAVPFYINLLNCEDDPAGSVARAHVKLDGSGSSSIIDKDLGLFSLDSSSTATGVGIQVLQDDGTTAITLGEDVPISRIIPGAAMRLNMRARYYQLGNAAVGGGRANGALNFTISYQ